MIQTNTVNLSCIFALISATGALAASDSALLEALVRKGILSQAEAAAIQEESGKEESKSSANKLKLSHSLTEMKLYGDLRLRYQFDDKDAQFTPGVGVNNNLEQRSPAANQRSRWRFRLRLNADFRLTENFYGGVELQTSMNADSANQTYQDGFNDYPIFISRAFLGWNPNDWLEVVAGKFAQPFYATDATWDPDINPTGLVERIAFHKMHFGAGADGGGYSKDGKTAKASEEHSPWELTLVAGQFIFDDNLEGGGRDNATRDNDETTDAYLFETQLIAAYNFKGGTKLTIAPAWFTYINGSLSGLDNENSFQDNANVSGATRNLNLLLLPGDVTFKLGSWKAKVYWDFSYNIEGRKRTEDIYNLVALRTRNGTTPDPDDFDKRHNNRDDVAWLIGLQLGENKKKGDWSLLANYRETGIAAVDPNLIDSDFAQSEVNTRGVKVGLAYNFTDFCIGAVTYMHAWNLRGDLIGGEATGGNAIAEGNVIRVFQVDLNLKF